MFAKVNRKWGCYVDLIRSKPVVIKIMIFNGRQSTSYQRHFKRNELWIKLWGKANFFLAKIVRKNEWHQIENKKETPLIVFEVQWGECFEDDIERA